MPAFKTIALLSSLTFSFTAMGESSNSSKIDLQNQLLNETSKQVNADQDYFLELEELFYDASSATMENIIGWRSGRCYTPNNIVLAGLLVGSHRAVEEHGPMFPPRFEDKFLILETPAENNAPADYFDNLSEVRKMELEQHIDDRLLSQVTELETRGGSLYAEHTSKPNEYRLRKSGDYILSQAITNDQVEGGTSESRVFRYCYFFKKIR